MACVGHLWGVVHLLTVISRWLVGHAQRVGAPVLLRDVVALPWRVQVLRLAQAPEVARLSREGGPVVGALGLLLLFCVQRCLCEWGWHTGRAGGGAGELGGRRLSRGPAVSVSLAAWQRMARSVAQVPREP